MPRARRRQPDPARFPPCARCGQCYPGGADNWPEGRVCKYCYLQARLRTGACADCGALTSLPGLNASGQPACTRCSGIPARFRCGCGREVTAGERGRCWWCVLAELVTEVLAGPGGEVPTHLRPLAEGLVSMSRPQSGVVWLRRSVISAQILQDLAHGRLPCSHAALDAAGADRAVEYLRCLLVRYGVLPPRDRRLADFQRWAAAKLDGIGNAGHRQLLERFLRWYLLRHLRSGSTTATPLGHGPYQRAKQRLTVAAAFLAWLASRGHQLGECTQHDLDSWFAAGPSTRQHALTFLSWARRQRILRGIELPVIHTEAGAPPPAPDVRLAAIRRLLLDDDPRPRRPHRRLPGGALRPASQPDRRAAHQRGLVHRCRHPAQTRRGLARRSRARRHLAPAPSAQPQQHDHRRQPGLALAVSRPARRRTSQLPPAHRHP